MINWPELLRRDHDRAFTVATKMPGSYLSLSAALLVVLMEEAVPFDKAGIALETLDGFIGSNRGWPC